METYTHHLVFVHPNGTEKFIDFLDTSGAVNPAYGVGAQMVDRTEGSKAFIYSRIVNQWYIMSHGAYGWEDLTDMSLLSDETVFRHVF